MNSETLEQGTQEWKDARAGFATASRVCDVQRKPKRGQKESTTRKAYMVQLAIERLTGKPQEREFETWDLKRGKEMEPRARVEYGIKNGIEVESAGFYEHPRIKWAGCSPDGLVGSDGLVQIKCPRAHVHTDYLLEGIVPVEYRPQMLFELAATGRKWSDFISYNRDMPLHLQLFQVRLHRDENAIGEIEADVIAFLSEVEALIAKLPKPDDPLTVTADDMSPWRDTLQQVENGKKLSEVK